jgi:hypothetical protein
MERLIMPIAVGTQAPDFTLKSKQSSGLVEVTLSQHIVQYNEQTATVKELPNFTAIKNVLAKLGS